MSMLTAPAHEIVRIPFHQSEILAIEVDGHPQVLLKPFIESIGLDFEAQRKKLAAKSWATASVTEAVGQDGKRRPMVTVDVRTALMLLATIDERRVAEDKRDLLVAYQSDVADVIEAYFTKGGAINPSATEDQLTVLATRAAAQAGVLAALRGVVDQAYLDVQGRFVISQALGTEVEIDPETRPLDVESYLRDTGISRVQIKSIRAMFGKRLKALFVANHGVEPLKVPREVNGAIIDVFGYTRRDLPLFDQVFEAMGLVRV